MDADTFRSQFPEFADEAAYPGPQIDFWMSVAVIRLNPSRWSTLLDQGIALYTAHSLALAKANSKVAAFGGTPGQNSGPLAQKGADKLSATYDTASASVEGAGNYNLTTYGTRFIELSRLAGMGGVYTNFGENPWPPGLSSIW